MSLQDFMDATYADVMCVIHGYNLRERDRTREQWEQTRMMCYWSVIGNVKPGSIKGPESIIKFPWDQKEVHVFSEDQRKAFLKKINIDMQVRKEERNREELKKQNKRNAQSR